MATDTLTHPPVRARKEGVMRSWRKSLVWICTLGGIAVLGSYAWGFLAQPEAMEALWGGVPESLRPLYTINMFLAAGGFFLFAPYIFFRLHPAATRVGRFDYRVFHVLFLMILIPSALWLPLTAHMVSSPSLALWWVIRLDLALVGLGAVGLGVALAALRGDVPRGRARALIGLVPFTLQTAVLDALVWPAYFPTP